MLGQAIAEYAISDGPGSAGQTASTVSFVGEAFAFGTASTGLYVLLRDRTVPLDYALEFGARNITTDAVEARRAATREFITLAAETPSNTRYKGTLSKVLGFTRSIVNGDRYGQVTVGWGETELLNGDGDYDDLISAAAVDGQRIVVKVAVAGSSYAAFQTLFDGTLKAASAAEDVMRLTLRDASYKLDVPALPVTYGGTGGLDGTAELEGRPKPRAFGTCLNVSPVSVEPSRGLYEISAGPILAVDAVYDRAVALAFARDYASSGALRSASTGTDKDIEPGQYATCLAQGLIRLGGAPVGTITCDVRGDRTGGAYVETTAGIVRRLLTSAATVLTDADLALYSFGTVDSLQPAPIGYILDGASNPTVADVVADLMGAIGGWGGMRRDGRYEVGLFTAPQGQPVASYDRIDIASITPEPLLDALSPPPYRYRVGYAFNWTVQTDVEGQAGVTSGRVAFLAAEQRYAETSPTRAAAIRADHPLAQDPEPIRAFFRDRADAAAEGTRLIQLYGTERVAYRIGLNVHPFLHEIGEVIRVTHPRFGLAAGKLFRIVSVSDSTDDDQVELVVFG